MSDQLRHLIAQWRARAKVNDRASIDHPQWADDLKAMADVWAVARRECATELEALLTERPQPTIEEVSGLVDDATGGQSLAAHLDRLRGRAETR